MRPPSLLTVKSISTYRIPFTMTDGYAMSCSVKHSAPKDVLTALLHLHLHSSSRQMLSYCSDMQESACGNYSSWECEVQMKY